MQLINLLRPAFFETLYMILVSTAFTVLIGLPLGVLLLISRPGHLRPRPGLYSLLSVIVNLMRSLPFIILLILVMPLTRLIVGSAIGTGAAIVPLTLAAVPFFARLVENSLLDIDPGIIEAASSMGASPMQIVRRVLIPEAASALVLNVTLTLINLLGYSAMAGAVGGGGLGHVAISYGFHRYQTDVMLATAVLLIVMVQFIQSLGNFLAGRLNHNRKS